MLEDPSAVTAEMRRRGLVPADCLSLFVGGSLARGWAHGNSDADVYVVSAAPWDGPADGFTSVQLQPSAVPLSVLHLNDRRWELRYWLDGQVDQMMAKVSWAEFERGTPVSSLSLPELVLLSRLDHVVPLAGADWIAARREELGGSGFRAMVMSRALAIADGGVEDALGLLQSGDRAAAVLSAVTALNASVDALVAYHGDAGFEEKWRARRLAEVDSPVLTFDRYWDLVTMRTMDPADPTKWVEETLRVCREVALEVEM